MQINPLIRNDRGRRIQNIPIKNADIFVTFVLLAIYKSLSNRAALPRCCLCPFAPYTHTDRYCYSFQIPICTKDIGNKCSLKTASHSTDCTDCTAQTALHQPWMERRFSGSISRIYLSLIHSFRPVSNWVSARLPTKKFGELGNEKIIYSFVLQDRYNAPAHITEKSVESLYAPYHLA